MSGKGDTPRPHSVDYKTYADNWERIFGKHPREPQVTPEVTQEVRLEILPEDC